MKKTSEETFSGGWVRVLSVNLGIANPISGLERREGNWGKGLGVWWFKGGGGGCGSRIISNCSESPRRCLQRVRICASSKFTD